MLPDSCQEAASIEDFTGIYALFGKPPEQTSQQGVERKGKAMTTRSTPTRSKKRYVSKAAIAALLVAVPMAVFAAPALADTATPGTTHTDDGRQGGQYGDHPPDWNNGRDQGRGEHDQNWQAPNWQGFDQGQPQPGPAVNPFAGWFGSS